MTIVTCDHSYPVRFIGEPERCGEEFRSCSDKSVIPKQLEVARWTTRPNPTGGANQDICPYHSELSVFRPSVIAHPPKRQEP